jgi:hypothetical protein
MRQVTDLASLTGWLWAHFRPAQTARGWRTPVSGTLGAGFPDLVLARPRDRRLLFVELKRDGGRTTDAQDAVLGALRYSGAEAYVWRPADIDGIVEVLK